MDTEQEQVKRCADCGTAKPVSQFYPRKGVGGYLAYCKPCHSRRTMAAERRRRGDEPKRIKSLRSGMPAGTKLCGHCGVGLPLECFPSRAGGGHRSVCRECHLTGNREARRANPEKTREANAIYREKNRLTLRARQAKWHAEHPEQSKAIQQRRRQKLRDVANAATHKRRAMYRQAPGHYTAAEWRALKARYAYRCLVCGRAEPSIKLTVDHIIPITMEGSNFIANIQPLCKGCNARKHQSVMDYRPFWLHGPPSTLPLPCACDCPKHAGA